MTTQPDTRAVWIPEVGYGDRLGNVRVVQELLRHKSLNSTQIYTQVAESDVSAVAEGLPHVA